MGSKYNAVFNDPVIQGQQPHVHEMEGSPNVFINAGGNAVAGLPIVDLTEILILPEINDPTLTEFQAALSLKDDEESDDGLAVFPTGTAEQSLNNGLLPNLPDPTVSEADDAVPVPVSEQPADCSVDIYSEPTNHNFSGSFQLSPNFTLADLTTNTALSNYPLISQHGLTTNEIVCNLRLLCTNVLEPIKAQHSNMFITSGFRHGSSTSQHEKGQAVDIQFAGFTPQEYWDYAKIVRDSIPYDQMILELGRSYWFHLSYKSGGRHNVLTRLRPGKYVPGLHRLV